MMLIPVPGSWRISMEGAREVAARVWCDHVMSSVQMDPHVAEKIANILFDAYGEDVVMNKVEACREGLKLIEEH